jgi:Gnt-I system high-affinity gluconate transporter
MPQKINDNMALLIVFLGILLLLVLIGYCKLNAFIALIVTSICVGLGEGMGGIKLMQSIQSGLGSTIGSLAMILGFGVMFGKLLALSGAAQQISMGMVAFFGMKQVKWAMIVTGFLVGIAMFYTAGFVVLMPLVFVIAARTKLPIIYLAIPTAAALSVTHGFLPPHPGPSAIVGMLHANMGKTLLLGIVVAIPSILVAGVLFPNFIKNIKTNPPLELMRVETLEDDKLPSLGLSILMAIIPVLMMAISTIYELVVGRKVDISTNQQQSTTNETIGHVLHFFGDPSVALLIALLLGIVFLGLRRGLKIKSLMSELETSIGGVAMILLVIGGGGAFKQVLIDSGVGNIIADHFKHLPFSPLFSAWLLAALFRIALGSATVAGQMAAGIILPAMTTISVSPELMVLAIGAGSLICSHVNDAGFWMFKEYFGLSLKGTFKSWTVMETIVSVVGILVVLIINHALF